MTDKLDEIAKALNTAQAEMEAAKRSGENSFFKNQGTGKPSRYSTLQDVMEAAKEPLAGNGLSYVQAFFTPPTGVLQLETKLMHNSGQYLCSFYPIVPASQTPQAMASAVTYARRISLAAMLGICADEDDDGNSASDTKPSHVTQQVTQAIVSDGSGFIHGTSVPRGTKEQPPYGSVSSVTKRSDAQVKRLWAIGKKSGWADAQITGLAKSKFGVDHLHDLPKQAYDEMCDRILVHPPMQEPMVGFGDEQAHF